MEVVGLEVAQMATDTPVVACLGAGSRVLAGVGLVAAMEEEAEEVARAAAAAVTVAVGMVEDRKEVERAAAAALAAVAGVAVAAAEARGMRYGQPVVEVMAEAARGTQGRSMPTSGQGSGARARWVAVGLMGVAEVAPTVAVMMAEAHAGVVV